jgi:glycosyl hydrolase family 12
MKPSLSARCALPFIACAALSCEPVGPAAAPVTAGGVTNCDQFGTTDVNGKEYVVQNNEWNSNQTQCVDVSGTSFTVTRANFALPTNGPPATYPAIFKGCHWGNCTRSSGMPVQVASLPAVTSDWTVTVPPTGSAFNVSYDLWFNRASTAEGQPDGTELMIWLDYGGGAQPAGSIVGTVSLGGATWNVWRATMGWTYVAYQRQTVTTSVKDLDLRAFVADSVARGFIDKSWYLIDIEAGFEIWRGGQGFATNSFRAAVGGT